MSKSYDDPDEVDPIDLKRIVREAQEREARRRHSAHEISLLPPSDESWPPQAIPGEGSPSAAYDPQLHRLERTSKATTAVWAIVVVLFGAFGGGFGARAFFGDDGTKAKIAVIEADLKDLKSSNQALRETLAGMQKDIEWIKGALEKSQQPKPLEAEKRKR